MAHVGVLDVGKTNAKFLLFDGDGNIAFECARASSSLPPDASCSYLRLDTEGVWSFFMDALREAAARAEIEALSISAHGAAGVLVGDKADTLPPMDYEWDGLNEDAERYSALRPPFEETLSPGLPRGLNLGRQLFHLTRRYPERASAARAFLTYPQYWAWRLSSIMASEVSALGAHTDLWRPREGRLSSLVESQSWGRLFPPLRRAYDTLGPVKPEIARAAGLGGNVRVLCGAHDSNAALVPYLKSRPRPFTVISTGTWVIVMAVGGQGALDPAADMLANVDVSGEPTPCARFMGGREFAVLSGDRPAPFEEGDVAALVSAGVFALPAFSDQGGPFAGRAGRIAGPAPETAEGRTALATLYVALMTAHMVERLQAEGDLIVEGSFARNQMFARLLAAFLPDRSVFAAESAAGAAEGAARLAHWSEPAAAPRAQAVKPWDVKALTEYRQRWLDGVNAFRP